MQALRLTIKLCLALLPFASAAADVKISVRVDGWRLIPVLQALERPYLPPVSDRHLKSARKEAPRPSTVFVGGVQYHLPSAPAPAPAPASRRD